MDANVAEITTDTGASSLCPSDVAVIVAEPTPTASTIPVVEMVTTVGSLVAHATVAPVTGFPTESRVIAVNCCACPTISVSAPGATVTDATGAAAVTVTAALSLCPSEVAVIVVEPTPTAVTSPAAETVAIVDSAVSHVIDRPGLQVTPGLIDCHSHSMILGGVNEGTLPSSAMCRIGPPASPTA